MNAKIEWCFSMVAFLLSTLLLTADVQLLAERDPARRFITADDKPTEPLIKLLKLSNLYDPNDRLPEIVQKTQKAWIKVIQGRDGKERTDLQDSPVEIAIRAEVEAIAKEIGLFNAREPALRKYSYGVCHGAFL